MTSGTAVDRIAAALREAILAGRVAPGAPLREERLAVEHGASRHTVRTALARLGATGLVVTEPFRGVRVARLDHAQAAALQDLRRALECEAADMLFRRHGGGPWPREARLPIEDAIDRLGAAEQAGDELEVLQAHTAVHLAMVAAASSARITEAHARLSDELALLLLHVRPGYGEGELEAQHRALLTAVERSGAEPVRAHLADTLTHLGASRA